MPQNPPPRNRANYLLVLAAILLLAPLLYSVAAAIVLSVGKEPEAVRMFLERPAPVHTECIKDTTYMRLHHWEELTANREKVVRYGDRNVVKLADCKRCHTSRERFCNRCHEAVNLYPECWGCHYYP